MTCERCGQPLLPQGYMQDVRVRKVGRVDIHWWNCTGDHWAFALNASSARNVPTPVRLLSWPEHFPYPDDE